MSKPKPLFLNITSSAFDISVLFPSLRDTGESDSFHIFMYFPCPCGIFYRKKQLKTFQRCQDRNKSNGNFIGV